ncbi:meiotic recombination protein SPO11-like [Tropilaelaps mercedesae]|uniref:Meiotic recombination protein SPO11-like n=1 Tax=Tropilaelaps mercedesae TaxID=418985 RepID=A0A1V9X4I4_9ACAR|nr:meiotic recombination protein SPO11-like [Tropilaelaps mercedesae]
MDLAEYFMTCVLVDKDLPCLDISGHLLHGIIPKGETQFRGNPIFLNLRQARSDERWGRLMIICEEVFQLLLTNQHSTVRRIFYLYKDTFKNPSHVAHSIEDLARLLSCTRRDLNVRATAKGLVYGNLEWRTTDGDNWCSCHSAPTSIPSDMRAVVEVNKI